MLIDFDTPILTIYNQPIHVPDPEGGAEGGVEDKNKSAKINITLRYIVVEALLADTEINRKLSRNDKMDRWELAKRVRNGGEQNVSPEELTLIRNSIDQAYGPAIVGPCVEALGGR